MAAANMLPNNSMNFTENQHGHAVLDTLRHQRDENAFCDVILHVQGQQFQAHRCVLAACSKYFQAMFKQEKVVKEQLTISCGGHEIFRCLLDYIYTGNVVIDKHNVSELVRLSNHFNVLKLRGHCSEYLERYLDVTNCLSVMDMAKKYQMAELLRTTLAFVKANVDEVLCQQEAMELPLSKVELLLVDKDLALWPERQLTFVLDWVRHSVSSRENELRQLLLQVPIQLLERGRLTQLVQTDALLAESERCLYFTLQSLADVGVRLPVYEQLFSQMEEKFMQDLVVDNDTFMSMAISTAIEELEGTEATIFDGLHRLQQQAAVSSGQNPPPIEMFSIAGIEDDLAGELAPAAEQETARDLRCHAAGEPRYQGRYQELLPAPAVRHQEYQETQQEPQTPPPLAASADATAGWHEKYQEEAADEVRYGPTAAEHARAAQRLGTRYRGPAECHQASGAYVGGGGGPAPAASASAADMQYVVLMKRPDKTEADGSQSAAAGGCEDRRLSDPGHAPGLQYVVYSEHPEPGGAVYCEQPPPPPLSQCRLESCRHAELTPVEPVTADARYTASPLPLEPRALRPICDEYEPLQEPASCRDQSASYLTSDGRVAHEPTAYVCEAATLQPLTAGGASPQVAALLYQPAGGRRAELNRLTAAQQNRLSGTEHARAGQTEDPRLQGAEQGRFELAEYARLDETGQMVVGQHEPPPAPAPPSPPPPSPPPALPLPMPAKKRKLDPGLAEELRAIQEQEFGAIDEQELRAIHEQGRQAIHEQEFRTANEQQSHRTSVDQQLSCQEQELRTGDGSRTGGADVTSGVVGDVQPSANNSPKKKRLRHPVGQSPTSYAELRPPGTTDLAPLLAADAAEARQQPCSRCPAVFAGRSALLKHVADKHRPGPLKKTFTCNICEISCDKKSLYVKHMLTHFEGPPFKCDICVREFAVFVKFLRHRREHVENKPHRCPECNVSFWKKCNLNHHMRIHTGEKPFRCEKCSAAFTLSTTLKQHMNSHSTEKKHFCDECDFSTKYANHLISHRKIHAGDLHRCPHTDCSYTTPKRSHLREHLQSHAKRRSHHCPQCQRTFNVKTHLSRHMRIHDESKLFRCTICQYTVHRSDRFKSHMATHIHPVPRGRKAKAKKPMPALDAEQATEGALATDWEVF